jgi:hypothetical protein
MKRWQTSNNFSSFDRFSPSPIEVRGSPRTFSSSAPGAPAYHNNIADRRK